MTNPPASRVLKDDAKDLTALAIDGHLGRASPAGVSRPWLTVVLGTGWSPAVRRQEYGQKLLANLTTPSREPLDGPFSSNSTLMTQGLDEVVRAYAIDLIQDRLSLDSLESPDEPEGIFTDLGFRLVATCAAVTMLFHGQKLLRPEAIKRAGHDDVLRLELNAPSFWLRNELYDRVMLMLESLRKHLEREPPTISDRLKQDILKTVERLRSGLSDERLSYAAIEDLTELSWSVLISTTTRTFPGWADLMLELSHDDGEQPVGAPRLTDVEHLGDRLLTEAIRARYEDWYQSDGAESDTYRPLHDTVAELMLAQASFRLSEDPTPVAFVTAFDLELELALMRTNTAFRVIFPVHVSSAHKYHLTWLSLDVPEGAELDSLRRPPPDQLRLVSSTDSSGVPTIVRLSGCPLIHLPPRGDERRNELEVHVWNEGFAVLAGRVDAKGQPIEPQSLDIRHAPICNEYLASYHTSFDVMAQSSATGESARLPGLPVESVVTVKGRWHRHWVLLGVQLGSSAIRQRLTAVLGLLTLAGQKPHEDGSGPEHSNNDAQPKDGPPRGLVVAEKIDWASWDLLSWRGLEIFTGDANELIPWLGTEAQKLLDIKKNRDSQPVEVDLTPQPLEGLG